MSCPHSTRFDATPETCSLCLVSKARQVSYDPETRELMLDGVLTTRGVDVEVNAPPNTGRRQSGGRREKTCSQCGKAGHTRATCGRQARKAA